MAIAPGAAAAAGYPDSTTTTTSGVTTQATGSLFLIGVAWEGNSTPPTISDSKGNLYTLIGSVRQTDTAYGGYSGLWYCENGTGGSSHTATATKAGAYSSVFFAEVTGSLTTAALDQHNGAALDTANPITSGTITTTQADEILIGFVAGACSGTTAYTPNNSFTSLLELTPNNVWQGCLSYRVVSATLTTECSTDVTNLISMGAIVASFKAAGGGGGGGSVVPKILLQMMR